MALDARKKEDTAIEALSSELDVKRKESEELQFKVNQLQAEVEAKEYDAKRAKAQCPKARSNELSNPKN